MMLCLGIPELAELPSLRAQQGDGSCTCLISDQKVTHDKSSRSLQGGTNGGIHLEPGLWTLDSGQVPSVEGTR
jgi:hypothetical protein